MQMPMTGAATHITLFGTFEARTREGTAIRPPGRRSVALIACIALKLGGWERDALAALLWHDRAPEQARASLRQELLRLRHSLGSIIWQTESCNPRLIASPEVDIDVLRFRLAALDPLRALEAIALYRGDLLELFTIAENPVLADRLALYRAELRLNIICCLHAVLQSAEASEAIARRLLAFDPDLDDAHAWLIRRYLELGHNAQALAAYGIYLQRVEARGVQPSSAIRQLVTVAARQSVSSSDVMDDRTTVWETRPWIQEVPARAHSSGRPDDQRFPVVSDRPSLVVLPVVDLSPGHIGSMSAHGLTEELTNALARIPGFFVISRHSAVVYRDTAMDVRDIAAELGVRYLLDSSVEISPFRIRVNTLLVDGCTGLHLWADTQDCQQSDLCAVRDKIVQAIVARLQPRPKPAVWARGQSLGIARERAERPVLGVFPLEVLPREKALQAVAVHIMSELAHGLWRSRVCEVAEFTSPEADQGAQRTELSYLLRGSLVGLEDGLRLSLRCVNSRQNTLLWSAQVGLARSATGHQRSWIGKAIGGIDSSIQIAEMRRAQQDDHGGRDLLLKAFALSGALEPISNGRALILLSELLDDQPDEPRVLALAAWCHAQRCVYNWSADARGDRSDVERFATAATHLGSNDPNCLTIIGTARSLISDHNGAGLLLDRARQLDPHSSWIQSRRGWLANYLDQPDRAIRRFQAALQFAPLDLATFNSLIGMGVAHFIRGDQRAAIGWMEKGLTLNPRAIWVYRNLVPAYVAAGRQVDAECSLHKLLGESPELSIEAVRGALVFSRSTMDRISDGLFRAGLPSS